MLAPAEWHHDHYMQVALVRYTRARSYKFRSNVTIVFTHVRLAQAITQWLQAEIRRRAAAMDPSGAVMAGPVQFDTQSTRRALGRLDELARSSACRWLLVLQAMTESCAEPVGRSRRRRRQSSICPL